MKAYRAKCQGITIWLCRKHKDYKVVKFLEVPMDVESTKRNCAVCLCEVNINGKGKKI